MHWNRQYATNETSPSKPRAKLGLGLLAAALLSAGTMGCSHPAWDGRVQQWGQLREVMRDGRTEARVRLADVTATPHCYAIGALEGLGGEVLILDGAAWIAQVASPGHVRAQVKPAPTEQAAFLVASWVPEWVEFRLERDIGGDDFDVVVRDYARRAGLDEGTFPFVIEGDFVAVRVHVVNGRCLMTATPDPDDRSFRNEIPRASGVLLGFYSDEPPGCITHHGTSTHVHALLHADEPLMAHVETVGVQQGAVIRLPRVRLGARPS